MFTVKLPTGETHQASEDFEAYRWFVKERLRILHDRLSGGELQPSEDPILRHYYFTNVHRVSDRTTQDLLHRQYTPGLTDEDIILRTLVFKLFNLTSTFDHLDMLLGVRAETFNLAEYLAVLGVLRAKGVVLYNNAYILNPAAQYKLKEKYAATMTLVDDVMSSNIVDVVKNGSMEDQYNYLLPFPSFGTFIAYQMVVDFGYTPVAATDENEFTMAGIGAVKGIQKCFPTVPPGKMSQLIHALVDQQEEWKLPGTGTLMGRPLHAIDVQNVFCETNKYTRIRDSNGQEGRNRVYTRHHAHPQTLFFPPKWGLQKEENHG